MGAKLQRPEGRDGAIYALNVAIDALNIAKDISAGVAPAQGVFGSISGLLTTIRDCIANEKDYVELKLNCADISKALDQGTTEKKPDDLSQSVHEAINQLTTTVAEIQRKVIKQSTSNKSSRPHHRAKSDKETIASWKFELNRILHVFNTELAVNTDTENPTPSGDQSTSLTKPSKPS